MWAHWYPRTRLYFQSVLNYDNSLLVFNGNTILNATSHYKEFSAVGYLSASEIKQISILSNLSKEGLMIGRDSEECVCGAPCFCLFASHFKSIFSGTLCGACLHRQLFKPNKFTELDEHNAP